MTDIVKFSIGTLQSIDLSSIDGPPPSAGARPIAPEHVEDLKKTMRASRHVPILVRPGAEGRFLLVDGQHRVEAARSRNWSQIDALVLRCSEEDAIFLGLTSNVTRKNLTALEVQALIKALEAVGCTSTGELAALLGMSRTRVKRARGLKKLTAGATAALRAKEITDDAAHELTKLAPDQQDAELGKIKGAPRDETRSRLKAVRGVPNSGLAVAPTAGFEAPQADSIPSLAVVGAPSGSEPSTSPPSSVASDRDRDPCWRVVDLEHETTEAVLMQLTTAERQARLAAATAARVSLSRWIDRLERSLAAPPLRSGRVY
ncbi:MAG: ParB N-terminal domain-containing protein [Archangium sp.]|nr:ParB N-terminal domain-containing protein [Archangium sp.]